MKLLALETATAVGSVALLEEGQVLGTWTLRSPDHLVHLLDGTDRLLRASGLAPGDLDALAVSQGPGSFTGLRVGLALAKGLALALGKPLWPVSTLAALAANLPHCTAAVCPVLDARRGEVFAGLYRWRAGYLESLMPEAALAPRDLAERLEGEAVVFVGEGARRYRSLLQDRLGQAAGFAPPTADCPSAAAVGWLAWLQARDASRLPPDPDALVPVYLRPSQAEEQPAHGNPGTQA